MSREFFNDIWYSLRFSYQPRNRADDMSSETYRWMLVDDFVMEFNLFRASNYGPSDRICGDESISRWYGLGGDWMNKGLPLYIAMDRKPDNGCEIQDACDGRSKVMIALKLVKGAREESRIAQDEGNTDSGLHGTKVLKELVLPWSHSGRVVVADSYFASVPCALEMRAIGLRFIGVIKTATKQYPQQFLSNIELHNRGDYKGVISEGADGYKLLAFVWVDRNRRYFISNCSSLQTGMPYTRHRWRQNELVTTNAEPDRDTFTMPQPKAAEIYYSSCAMIDRHNRSRQKNLMIERKFGTHNWSLRVNLTIFSIIVVDAWNVMKGMLGDDCEDLENNFYELLASEMIDNRLDHGTITRRVRRRLHLESTVSPRLMQPNGTVSSGIGAHLTPTRRKRKHEGSNTNLCHQGYCGECGKKTTWVCSTCRDEEPNEKEKFFCHPKKRRLCFSEHLEINHS